MQIHLRASLDPKAPAASSDFVTFETGASRSEIRDLTTFAYNHHGEGFNAASAGALSVFFEDLILGRPMPEKFVAHRVDGMDTIVAMTLFLRRDLAVLERTAGFVATIDLLHRRGFTVLGHVSPEVEHLAWQLTEAPDVMNQSWLTEAVDRVAAYLQEGVIDGQPFPPRYRVIDTGTNGFVLATAETPQLLRVWTALYRQGYLRGVVLGPEGPQGHRAVLASRKSPFVTFDLGRAAAIFNEMESAMGVFPTWTAEEDWLQSSGTLLVPSDMMQVFVRV